LAPALACVLVDPDLIDIEFATLCSNRSPL